FSRSGAHRDLHSFPTRRSSDLIGQMSQQVGIAYELYAIAAAVLGGCSLRGGEGTVLGMVVGSAMMRVIDNGINMFQIRYEDSSGDRKSTRLNSSHLVISYAVFC